MRFSDKAMIANTHPPNIIYILGDDHRAEQLGCADHPIVRTPELDRLAGNGVRFREAFCTSPACTPSRTCHYTGKWERRHGINFNSGTSLSEAAWAETFPQLLRQAGYFTGWIGKNHVPVGEGGYESGAMERSFDYWYGNHGHSGFYAKEKPGSEIYHNARAHTQPEIFTEAALDFLRPDAGFREGMRSPPPERPADRPFCLCLTFNLPHANSTGQMQLRPEDDPLYKEAYRESFKEIPLPETYQGWGNGWAPRLPEWLYNHRQLASYDYVRTPQTLRERRVREYQTITGMDRCLGAIRRELAAQGLADNTLIVFSTDHGIHHGEHGLGGKCFLYEEDLRIPLILYDPRLPEAARGTVRDEMVAVPDLAPTMLESCGQPVPAGMQGRSLRLLLEGESPEWREALFTEQLMDIQNYPRSESLRTKDWKYVRYFRRTEDPKQEGLLFRSTLDDYASCLRSTLDGTESPAYEELFDLRNDPRERENKAEEPACREILGALRERLLTEGRGLVD